MSDIPTPESDAVERDCRNLEALTPMAELSRSLERRLAVAVGALKDITAWSVREDNLGQAKQYARTILGRIDAMKEGRDEMSDTPITDQAGCD